MTAINRRRFLGIMTAISTMGIVGLLGNNSSFMTVKEMDLALGDHVWGWRAQSLAIAIWPAMVVVARENGGQVSKELFFEMLEVESLERFTKQFPDLKEAHVIRKYLTSLPGYGIADARRSTLTQHSYISMQLAQVVEQKYGKA